MPTNTDPQNIVAALLGGMPPVPGPAAQIPLDRINKGMPYELGGGAYNDSPTLQQSNRDIEHENEMWAAGKAPNTVIPPDMVTQDNMATPVISPSNLPIRKQAFGEGLPPTYGVGKYKIYTPNYQAVVPPIQQSYINLLRKGMLK